VHMLSHLVGAANRADIRRLRQLEEANAELEAKVGRQQQQLRDAVVSRETTIRELRRALEEQIFRDGHDVAKRSTDQDSTIWTDLVADLKRRLATAASRCERLEIKLEELRSGLVTEHNARAESDRQNRELRQEIEAIEASLSAIGEANEPPQRLPNLTLLYVGGRQAQIAHLRMVAERAGATLLHHDGGIEERNGLLQGHISRADAVLFPVDCVSHAAMSLLKRLCRQSGKPFLPLRGPGLAPFCAALNSGSVLASPVVPGREA
jgi:DNA repair exonuclease SbcCD ATPase subunit